VHNESIFVIYRNTIKSPPKTTRVNINVVLIEVGLIQLS